LADDEDSRMRANHESLRGCWLQLSAAWPTWPTTAKGRQGPCACQDPRRARTRSTGGRVSVSPSARSVRPAAGYEIRCAWCGDVMRLTTHVFYEVLERVGHSLRSVSPQESCRSANLQCLTLNTNFELACFQRRTPRVLSKYKYTLIVQSAATFFQYHAPGCRNIRDIDFPRERPRRYCGTEKVGTASPPTLALF
jgi:hypothetical protein